MLSITTDYARDVGDPSPYLKRIGEAGFSHIHWCHQWNTDFLYSKWEIEQIEIWLKEFGLKLLDLHGSAGKEKAWASPWEYQRLSGVELVKNRIDMVAYLGADVVIMHVPADPDSIPIRKSLDELQPYARERNVRIAIENGHFPTISKLLSEYPPDYLGLCYDSGHGNVPEAQGLDNLEKLKDRLISVHLHDNDASGDQHKMMFMGTVDWERLANIMAHSSYKKPVSMELSMGRSGFTEETEMEFLAKAFETGTKFANMIEKYR
ncbi:TPA: sugar phosphate isomerase/epimerase [Candidatus Poribacteria bacterium]|nr:sugar phosphate isomerase/epimerase [Candidatus Poribacteria bacterium]